MPLQVTATDNKFLNLFEFSDENHDIIYHRKMREFGRKLSTQEQKSVSSLRRTYALDFKLNIIAMLTGCSLAGPKQKLFLSSEAEEDSVAFSS
jgi:hypothetical protein